LAARSVGLVEGEVTGIVADADHWKGVQMFGGRVILRDAVFVPPRLVPNNGLLISLGCVMDDAGWAVNDGTGQNAVPGVWVAGNVSTSGPGHHRRRRRIHHRHGHQR
jgi:thioredoxin reductase